jgi:hypothetical protein
MMPPRRSTRPSARSKTLRSTMERLSYRPSIIEIGTGIPSVADDDGRAGDLPGAVPRID